MIVLTQKESEDAFPFLKEASKIAQHSLCLRDRCGAVVVSDGVVIGAGYNAPPHDDILARKCTEDYTQSPKPKSDRTCCMHAEWRALINALTSTPALLKGAALYLARIDENRKPQYSGDPYCTVCSRLALDVGIATFVLWREDGICVYDTKEYNERSYAFHREPLA